MKATAIFIKLFLLTFVLMPVICFSQGSTMSDPIIMGSYAGGSFTFTDSRPNVGYGNEYATTGDPYQGQMSEDIFYRFTVQGSAEVSFSTCASDFDTYIHLLKNDGSPLEHNDDNGPLCAGSRASIKTTLAAGTYYLVVEGYGTASGMVSLSVTVVVQSASPAALTGDSRNFTKLWEATAPERDANQLMGKPLREVKQSTTYFDGLGRAEQTVIKQGSLVTSTSTRGDLVSPVVYDAFGREADKYLPYVAVSTNGLFKESALAAQSSFYLGVSSPLAGQGEQYFYSKTIYEASSLNRIATTMAPGNSWVGAGRGVALSYQTNNISDQVRIWKVTEVVGEDFGRYRSESIYAEGSLFKNVTTDEQGKKVVEYKDNQGKVILKKVQETEMPGQGHTGWLCTYYIYDDLDRLRAVLQPAAVQLMNDTGSWTLDVTTLDELTFRYEYDARARMTKKKVPGAGAVYMVYDARDRLVMTQDANLRKPSGDKWLVTVYDELNRPIRTGLWFNSGNLQYHLERASGSISYPSLGLRLDVLTFNQYDDYPENFLTGFSSSLIGSYASSLKAEGGGSDFAQALSASPNTKGLVTLTFTRVLGETKFLFAVYLYDDKGRVIQTQMENYTGGIDISTTQYDFSGKVLGTHLEHHKGSDVASGQLQLATRNSYDDLGRISKIEKNINNTFYKAIAVFEYDALGQLKNKKIAPDFNNNQGLETLGYDYNIRGWLLGMNRSYLRDKNSLGYNTRFFGFELGYDKGGTEAGTSFSNLQYNGNIAGALWKSAGDEVRRKYDFTYDPVNRFGKADFTQNTDPFSNGPYNISGANFSVHGFDAGNNYLMQYDANGNILSMVQHGIKGSTPDAVIDALRYTYFTHSNKLRQVTDDNNDKTSTLGDFKYDPATKTSVDYGYDKNGNLITDLNKNLGGTTGTDISDGGAISYNHLNLPSLITVAGKGTIEYLYDASGNKLSKRVHETGKPDKTTLYMTAGIVYQNDTLQFVSHEEGRIRPLRDPQGSQVTGYAYDYFLKDHLGNVRMVLTDEQSQDSYPVASLESQAIDKEKVHYRIPEGSVVNKANVPGYPQSDSYTSPNDYVQRLNGNGQKVGTSIVLKVMSGDKVNIRASSWYRQNGVTSGSSTTAVADIVASLVQGMAGVPGGKIGVVTSEQQQVLSSGVASFLRQQGSQTSGDVTKPKSYLNWLLLDEQLNPVITSDGQNSGFEQVGADQQLTIHQVTQRPITKNGYLYIYLSNESPGQDVLFDNLQVTHIKGPLLEETHYYPFGLEMAGISSKAAGRLENKKRYNGIEFDNDLDLNTYEAFYRNLDPQLGRWWQIDPKVEEGQESWSPYNSMFNNPVKYDDPKGDCPLCGLVGAGIGGLVGGAIEAGTQLYKNGKVSDWGAVGGATVQGAITGGVAGLTGGASVFIATAASATANLIGGAANNTLQGKENTVSSLITDAAVGAATGIGGKLLEKFVSSKTLYRAVSENEVTDMAKHGVRNTEKGYETGKLFAKSVKDAAQYGKDNYRLDGIPNTIVKVKVPKSVMKTTTTFEADGMKAVSIPANQLQKVKPLGPLNYTPKPTNPFNSPGW